MMSQTTAPTRIDTPIGDGIADTLDYLARHWQEQPSLEALAARAGWSLSHFQRAFTEHVGVSPKRVLQFLTIAHARDQLSQGASLLDASLESGLSGPSRLHDLFVAIEAMTPGDYKSAGADLRITYGWGQSLFGPVLLGITDRGICWLAFAKPEDSEAAEAEFHSEWRLSQRLREAGEQYFLPAPPRVYIHDPEFHPFRQNRRARYARRDHCR